MGGRWRRHPAYLASARRLLCNADVMYRVRFDRGTLLLEDQRPQAAASADPPMAAPSGSPALAELTWDPRVGAWRAPAFKHGDVVAALAGAGQLHGDDARAVPPSIELADVELRPYQEAALQAWELAGRRGIVVLPTGSGKTRVAIAVLARTRLAAMCLVPTRVLMEQWVRELHAVTRAPVGRLGDGLRDIQPITVATFESAYRHMPRLGNRFDLLVVDEAHHFGRGMRDEALEMSLAPARLGLTATPASDPDTQARVDQLLGPVVFELAVGDLAGRYLADLELVTLHVDLTAAERHAYDVHIATFAAVHRRFRSLVPGGTWEDFARAARRTPQGRAALASLREARAILAFPEGKRRRLAALLACHQDARVLVFTSDNPTAYAIARHHLIAPLTCDIGRAERAEVLERFRRGELRALVSARVLNEGVDVPDADVAIVVGGTQGAREHVQRMGRLLRPAPGKRALAYELVVRGSLEIKQARRRGRALAPRAAALV